MNLAEIYPAKNKVFTTTKWENWNKMPKGTDPAKNYFNVQRIRRTSEIHSEPKRGKDLGEFTFLNTTFNGFNLKKTNQRKRDNSSTQRFIEKEIIREKASSQIRNITLRESSLNEKYSYCLCVGKIDIRGVPITPNYGYYNFSRFSVNSPRLKKISKRVGESNEFRLPGAGSPSPWIIMNKASDETLMKIH